MQTHRIAETHWPDEPELIWEDEERFAQVAENAYLRAERRGFLPGHEIEDWLAAELEIVNRNHDQV